MLSVSAEHIYDVPRFLNAASSQLLNLLFAELAGMTLGPRYSTLHFFGIMLFRFVAFLSGVKCTGPAWECLHCFVWWSYPSYSCVVKSFITTLMCLVGTSGHALGLKLED